MEHILENGRNAFSVKHADRSKTGAPPQEQFEHSLRKRLWWDKCKQIHATLGYFYGTRDEHTQKLMGQPLDLTGGRQWNKGWI
jgi:hypothetical protein